MTLMDALRQAEQQVKRAAHRGSEKIRSIAAPASTFPDPEEREASASSKVRTGIVSVNGRDVEQMRCTGGRSMR
jgi:hypothetical protein